MPTMLSAGLFCLLLCSLVWPSAGQFVDSWLDASPSSSAPSSLDDDLNNAWEYLARIQLHDWFDLPVLDGLLEPLPLVVSSHHPRVLQIPSYATYDGQVQIHGNLREQSTLGTGTWDPMLNDFRGIIVNRTVNSFLIEASINPEHGWRKRFPLLNDTIGWVEIAQRRIENNVLVGPLTNTTVNVQISGFRHTPIELTTDSYGDIRANIQLSDCPFHLSKDVLFPAVDAFPAYTPTQPTKIRELDATFFMGDKAIHANHNSTVLLVPPVGLTISSDIDDVLRVAEVWNWKQAMLWLVARPYKASEGMPSILRSWKLDESTHFHYTTDTITLNAPFYISGTEREYPKGSWDFRPFSLDKREMVNALTAPFRPNSSHDVYRSTPLKEISDSRYSNLKRLLQHFPQRRFLFMGDTSTSSTCSAYPRLAKEHPDQVACILIRNTRATEEADWQSSDTHHFLSLPRHKYFFYDNPKDLLNISVDHLRDVAAGKATGCFPPDMPIPLQSYRPSKMRGKSVWSLFRGTWYRFKCWVSKHKHCPFDKTDFKLGDFDEEDVQFAIRHA